LQTWLECIRSLFSDEGLSASAVASMDSVVNLARTFLIDCLALPVMDHLILAESNRSRNGSGRSTPVPSESREADGVSVRSSSVTSLASIATKPKARFFAGSLSNLREKFGTTLSSACTLLFIFNYSIDKFLHFRQSAKSERAVQVASEQSIGQSD
jgi:hypothetical protein